MKKQVFEYIKSNKLFQLEDKLILAISGGIDSVCLMNLLLELGYSFDLAHCNFNLRGKESEEDKKFVEDLAKKYHLKLHYKSFETQDYADEFKISIQMAARELRYNWFNNLLLGESAKYLLTAHNNDDLIETFFINLIRGSGMLGLSSISEKKENLVRPLLCVTRNQIEEYLKNKKIKYRIDSSNESVKYQRNKIRHKFIPLLEEMNPGFKKNLAYEIDILKETYSIFNNHINTIKKEFLKYNKGIWTIDIKKLRLLKPLRTYLFELLKDFCFNKMQIEKIIRALDSQCGKTFYSENYYLIIDRKKILIQNKSHNIITDLKIKETDTYINQPIKLKFSYSDIITINKLKKSAYLDYNKLTFPLILRKWKKGDRFKPLGMDNFKKISDYFIDNKFSIIHKKQQWILCSSEDIVWIVGHRIDDRFKVTSNTKKLYIAEVL